MKHKPFLFYPRKYAEREGQVIEITSNNTRPITGVPSQSNDRLWLSDTLINLLLLEFAMEAKGKARVEVFLQEQMCPGWMHNIYTDLVPGNEKDIRTTIRSYIRGTRTRRGFPDITDRVEACEVILVPINTTDHWALGVIDRRLRAILFFNTMKESGMVEEVRRVLTFIGESMIDEDISTFVFHNLSDIIPQQRDGWSCGYHLLRYGKMIVEMVSSYPGNVLKMHNASVGECLEFREYLAQVLLIIQGRGGSGNA